MSIVDKAIQFATVSHANQTRKGSSIPYILHPLEAGAIAGRLSQQDGEVDQEVIAAAILHDVIEDSFVSRESLVEVFGERVTELVEAQSEDKTKSWEERKAKTIQDLKYNELKEVEIVILADKLANMRSIYKDYEVLGNELWGRFNETDKKKHEWYYSSIANNINILTNTKEYREYCELIMNVFGKY